MSESFVCGDPGALVSYVYDECEPEERGVIVAHLARCASCSREVEDMGSTRRYLGSWAPPATELGFRIRTPEASTRAPWWQAPLPAWAQAAAAVLIFGAGLATGWARSPGVVTQPGGEPGAVAVSAASRTELAEVEQRLKAEMAQLRTTTTPAAVPEARQTDDAIMRRVQTLVEESEERQRREFTLRAVELARDFEAQRRVDLASMRESFGQFQGVAGAEIRQQREAIDRIMISLQGR